MATSEQMHFILEALQTTQPRELFRAMDMQQAGIGAVLRLVYESEDAVTAGKIADYMGVSTARVAVLLKKMAQQGLIFKESDKNDARVTVVRLSEKGRARAEQMRAHLYASLDSVIDKIGMARLEEFIAISQQIRESLEAPEFDL